MARRTFKIEKKTFVVDSSKESVEFIEKSISLVVLVVVEVDSVRWLIELLKRLVIGENVVGFIRSREGAKMDILLNMKKNKAGAYLSLLCLATEFSKGFKVLYFP